MNNEKKVLVLRDAVLVVKDIAGVAKMVQPATMQTPDLPYIHVVLRQSNSMLITYEDEETRDEEFAKITQAMQSVM